MDSQELLRELRRRVQWLKDNPVSTLDGKKGTRAQAQALLVQATALTEISQAVRSALGDEEVEIDVTSAARELAEEHGLDLREVALQRRLGKRDVEEFIEEQNDES